MCYVETQNKTPSSGYCKGFLIYLRLSFLLSTSVQEIVSCLYVFGISRFSLYYLYSSTKLCQLALALSVAARHLSQRERQVWIARKGKKFAPPSRLSLWESWHLRSK